jgi:hypothetical protein
MEGKPGENGRQDALEQGFLTFKFSGHPLHAWHLVVLGMFVSEAQTPHNILDLSLDKARC